MEKLRDIKEIMQRIDFADMIDEIGDVDDDSMMIMIMSLMFTTKFKIKNVE